MTRFRRDKARISAKRPADRMYGRSHFGSSVVAETLTSSGIAETIISAVAETITISVVAEIITRLQPP